MRHPASLVALLALASGLAAACSPSTPLTDTTRGALGSASVSTDAATYQPVQAITVSWDQLPAAPLDWIALAPAGSELTASVAWAYTGGSVTGSTTFASGLLPGSYVARAFADDSYALIAESPAFTVSAVGLTASKTAYLPGEDIAVTWSGLPGNAHDWVGLAPQGADPTTVTAWVYTGGATGGLQTFAGLTANGTYVARAFVDDGYTVITESAPFTVSAGSATVTTDFSTYAFTQRVQVTFSGLGGTATDWIALAPAGSGLTTVDRWVFTGGAASGTIPVETPTSLGTYVARAFSSGTYVLAAESASFTIAANAGAASTTTDAATYATGADITVTWAGLTGAPGDWIALAPDGSGPTTVTRWVYAGGAAAGSTTFAGGLLAPGTYVARTFVDDSYNQVQESAAFTVQ